jgi:hypothetical protein
MSKQAVEQMIAVAANDVALRQKLEAAEGVASAIKAEAKAVLIEHGVFPETRAEGELSEQALEAVAGGVFDNWNINIRWGW